MNRTTTRSYLFVSLRRFAALAWVAVAVQAAAVQAVTIPYGNFFGATVDYLGVEEIVDPGNGLFGAPTIAGDALDFNPQGFSASANGGSTRINDSNLRFGVMAKTGNGISGLYLSEAGDVTLTGQGFGLAAVTTTIFVEITEVNGNTPVSINVGPPTGTSMAFTPSDGDYALGVDDVSLPGFYQSGWFGDAFIDFGPALAANGITGFVSKIFVSLDNTLTAASSANTSSFIQKKDADGLIITIETEEIPEPSSIVSALIALALGGFAIRRK
ncbi:MAG: hypothetical protein KF688_00070 [Pirellulales bacterium]|nr:hypothetical protein [Pirellulales bacterium]